VNTSGAITFGPFRLDLRAGLLLRGREPIPLRPKTWSVLRYLAERPGALVTKQELLDAVWADAVVNESVLTKSIGELRVALTPSPARVPSTLTGIRRGATGARKVSAPKPRREVALTRPDPRRSNP